MKQNSSEPIIRVSHISKSFKLPHQKVTSIKGLFVNVFKKKTKFEKQEVLRDVSFDVHKGEFLGIVGRNGGGKSTILKLLAEIYEPDSGSIHVGGSMAPFIELGVGFNPELTGRENVFLNGALLGFNHAQMAEMYDDIVAFAELERFMDQKLKNYSSGMQVRLAFSVAIKAHTEILLIDEVLAVGDANFQKKCFDVFESFKEEGRTVVFISHSMDSVRKFCDRAILLDKGKVRLDGETEVVAAEYDLLNNESMKDQKNRITIKNPREAHIVEKVLGYFSSSDTLLEVGSASNSIVKLLASMGMNTRHTEKDMKGIKGNESGLLLLDNHKELGIDEITKIADQLSKGKLKNIDSVYVHLPYHIYQQERAKKQPALTKHLGEPLDMSKIFSIFKPYGFEPVDLSLYGTDEDYQYIEAYMKRFDKKRMDTLWPSLVD